MPAINAITPDKLARLIGTPHGPTIIDVRMPEDFDAEPHEFSATLQLKSDGSSRSISFCLQEPAGHRH